MLYQPMSLGMTSSLLLPFQAMGMKNAYRKKLGIYSFKLGKYQKHRNPHAMSLRKRQDLMKLGHEGHMRIKETERISQRPFGKFWRSQFRFNIEKVPFYNIPDLTDFEVSLNGQAWL